MFKILTASLAASVTAVVLAGASAASANVLTFDGNICAGGQACTNYALIDNTYGDIAGKLDVQYLSNSNGTGTANLSWWDDYSGDPTVAYGDNGNNAPEIFLKPLDGEAVTLTGFDLSSFNGATRTSQYKIVDGDGTVLYSSGILTITPTGATHFAASYSSTTGIGIQFGPDGYNVGIDNVDFTLGAATGGGVPEPASWMLMIVGFGGLGAALRRTRARTAFAA